VIAEGIETPAQMAQLRLLGCALGQGYLLARPLSADSAAAVLQVERRWPGPDARPSDFGRFVPTGYGEASAALH
jgi:predicted signal transduction protein with EAL and GGDEF domain